MPRKSKQISLKNLIQCLLFFTFIDRVASSNHTGSPELDWVYEFIAGPIIAGVILTAATTGIQIAVQSHRERKDKENKINDERNNGEYRLADTLVRNAKQESLTPEEWAAFKNLQRDLIARLKKQGFDVENGRLRAIASNITPAFLDEENNILIRQPQRCPWQQYRRRINLKLSEQQIIFLADQVRRPPSKDETPYRETGPEEFDDLGFETKSQKNAMKKIRKWYSAGDNFFFIHSTNAAPGTNQDDLGGYGRGAVAARYYNEHNDGSKLKFWINASTKQNVTRYLLKIYDTYKEAHNPQFTTDSKIDFAIDYLNTHASLVVLQGARPHTVNSYLMRLQCKTLLSIKKTSEWGGHIIEGFNEATLGPVQYEETKNELLTLVNDDEKLAKQLYSITGGILLLVELAQGVLAKPGIIASEYIERIASASPRTPRTKRHSPSLADTFFRETLEYIDKHLKEPYAVLCFCATLAELTTPNPFIQRFLKIKSPEKSKEDIALLLKHIVSDLKKTGVMAPHKRQYLMIRKCILIYLRDRLYNPRSKKIYDSCPPSQIENLTCLIQCLIEESKERFKKNPEEVGLQLTYYEASLPFLRANEHIFALIDKANFMFFYGFYLEKRKKRLEARQFFLEAKEIAKTIKEEELNQDIPPTQRDALLNQSNKIITIARILNACLNSDMQCGLLNAAEETFNSCESFIRKHLRQMPDQSSYQELQLIASQLLFNNSKRLFYCNDNEGSQEELQKATKLFDTALEVANERFSHKSTQNLLNGLRRHLALLQLINNQNDNPIVLISHNVRRINPTESTPPNDIAHLKAVRDCLIAFEEKEETVTDAFDIESIADKKKRALKTFNRIVKKTSGYPKALAILGSLLVDQGTEEEASKGLMYLQAILDEEKTNSQETDYSLNLFSCVLCFSNAFRSFINHDIKTLVAYNNRALIEPWLVAVLHLANYRNTQLSCYYHWVLRYTDKTLFNPSQKVTTDTDLEEKTNNSGGSKETSHHDTFIIPIGSYTNHAPSAAPLKLIDSTITDTAFALLALHAIRTNQPDIAELASYCLVNTERLSQEYRTQFQPPKHEKKASVEENRFRLLTHLREKTTAREKASLPHFKTESPCLYRLKQKPKKPIQNTHPANAASPGPTPIPST